MPNADSETLYTGVSQLVTPQAGQQRGAAMCELTVIAQAAMLVRRGLIVWVGREADAPRCEHVHDLGGAAATPALVDPHTHAVWAGDRLDDFQTRVEGQSYEAILAAGGGIRSTMRATAAAGVTELADLARPRLRALVASGAATVEVKSGYGLDFASEIRMLLAIRLLAGELPCTLVPTVLLHLPPETGRGEYVRAVCQELIPQVAAEGLAAAVDVFCEQGAFTVPEARQIALAARANGLPFKLHADQFHAFGGTELACELGALSVDHLEASTGAQMAALGAKPAPPSSPSCRA